MVSSDRKEERGQWKHVDILKCQDEEPKSVNGNGIELVTFLLQNHQK